MKTIIMSVTEKYLVSNEEAPIDQESDVFDTEITISPISMSRANMSDSVGKKILFLEAVQSTIVPYTVKVTFPFLEFICWCAEQYSQEEKVVVNINGSEVLCRVESLSIRGALGIPESFSVVSVPFKE